MLGCPSSPSSGVGETGLLPATAANQVSEAPRKPKSEIRSALQEGKTVLPPLINVYCTMECGPWSCHGSVGEVFLGGSGQYALQLGQVHGPRGHYWLLVGRTLKTEELESL